MCVSQFRDYVNASRFKRDEGTYASDLDNENLEVRPNSYKVHFDKGEEYDRTYYVTDLNKMKELSKNNNQYAIEHLNKQ